MTHPFILFITGTSASGKTTLYESLRNDNDLNGIEFHDIDENGVPPVGRVDWRAYRVTQLFYDAVKLAKDTGRPTVICGITFPHEVIESIYFDGKIPVHFILVEPTETQIRERLQQRSKDQEGQDGWDEVFSPENIERTITGNIEMRRTLHNSTVNQRNGHKIDTSSHTREEMHDEAKRIIQAIQKG